MKKVILLALSLIFVFSVCTAFADIIFPEPEETPAPSEEEDMDVPPSLRERLKNRKKK